MANICWKNLELYTLKICNKKIKIKTIKVRKELINLLNSIVINFILSLVLHPKKLLFKVFFKIVLQISSFLTCNNLLNINKNVIYFV